ncbi:MULTISPECIES: hypothetical protein [unclassified Gilliamella]|uniref:restriction endonuclease subunit S n=1 Tax=unclassified Gilliamella TaxID=2685620 RepID=UPI002269915C|nr:MULTISPECIES: hypothetical protein [unclassified Gilliamella]MCX8641348.1 hypothetical protein [Gilliamella sp. B3835]MCX8707458.1 hypothetical protein [Gilliamella sp. B3783]MCX8710538.1 hypothetical protein [Gilliamella sp. B3780]MCX8714653.1 hypothetical protein [Gilliamella sp. B3781]MCX8716535.1 hypothetical protein [Gilliamella sp. B3784]
MLEGLEIKEIMLKTIYANKDYRIDSQFHTETVIKNLALSYKRIGDILLSSQYGISIEMNENRIGYPIYRMNEIHSMLCDLNVNKSANINLIELSTFKLNDKDVLFNRTNSYEWVGRTGVYYNNEDNRIFASYLVRFIPDPLVIKPEYLACFLSSKFGVKEIKRRARESINQTNVNPEEVKEIEIPILSKELQNCVEDNFVKANRMRIDAATLYNRAENFLLREISLYSIDNNATKNIKSLKESFLFTGRLDAEYYQPKYDDLFYHLSQLESKKLGEIVSIKKSIEPGSDAYQDTGIPFVRVSNLSKFGLTKPEIHLDANKYGSATLYPKKDTILLSKDGSVGIAYKIEEDMEIITSGALLHLNMIDNEFLPDYLTLVLNSKIVQLQAERDAGGSIIQHWKPSEIEEVIIPKLPLDHQKKISDLIQQSFKLKKQSEQLLEVAKKAVEIAIEQNEATAIDYINSYSELIQEDGNWD